MNHSFLLITVYSLHFICSVFNHYVTFDFDNLSSSVYELPPNSFAFFMIFLLFLIIFRKSIQFSFQFL